MPIKKNNKKILIVVGTRPNFVKIKPLLEEFKKRKNIKPVLVHTGQHYNFEMSDIFFKELGIRKPDYNLNARSGLHGKQTAKILTGLEKIYFKEKPDMVVVLGDVNSTLAGALAASKMGIPLCHIESGLRSYDKKMPEEINRVLTDHVSDFLFCPTENAVENLREEGIQKNVYNTGDLMYDIFLKNENNLKKHNEILQTLKITPQKYLLLTIHRASNTENPKVLENIIRAVAETRDIVIFPCHPRTEKVLGKTMLNGFRNIRIVKPVGYMEMLCLEKNAKKIITDSGGVQKEAYWFKVPCITLRDNAEWVETVKSGWNILVGGDRQKIVKAIKCFEPDGRQEAYYGSGKAAKKITDIITQVLKNG